MGLLGTGDRKHLGVKEPHLHEQRRLIPAAPVRTGTCHTYGSSTIVAMVASMSFSVNSAPTCASNTAPRSGVPLM